MLLPPHVNSDFIQNRLHPTARVTGRPREHSSTPARLWAALGGGQTPGLSSRALFGVVLLAPHKLLERSQQKASAGTRKTPWGTIAAKRFSHAKAAVCASEAELPGAGMARRKTVATQALAVCAGCEKPLEVWCRAELVDSPGGFSASLMPGTAADTVPKQRWASLCQQGHPALTPHPGPSRVLPGAGCGFSAGSQLSARAESPARGREHREPPSSWPKERQRPGTLQGPGGRQRALGAWLEQGWSCPGGGGTPLNPTGPWGGGHRCLGCTPSCPGHRTGWSRGSWARSGSQSHTGAVISSRFLLVVVLWWDRHGSYRCRESQASFSLSREAEPRDHH